MKKLLFFLLTAFVALTAKANNTNVMTDLDISGLTNMPSNASMTVDFSSVTNGTNVWITEYGDGSGELGLPQAEGFWGPYGAVIWFQIEDLAGVGVMYGPVLTSFKWPGPTLFFGPPYDYAVYFHVHVSGDYYHPESWNILFTYE